MKTSGSNLPLVSKLNYAISIPLLSRHWHQEQRGQQQESGTDQPPGYGHLLGYQPHNRPADDLPERVQLSAGGKDCGAHFLIHMVVHPGGQHRLLDGKDVAEVIADNCPYKAILKASEPETQEWCSKLVGTYDKKKVSSNYNADILGVGKGQGTSSSTEEKRIIKPEEFAYLKDVVCVFPNGYKRLQKANYYEDKTFTDRM